MQITKEGRAFVESDNFRKYLKNQLESLQEEEDEEEVRWASIMMIAWAAAGRDTENPPVTENDRIELSKFVADNTAELSALVSKCLEKFGITVLLLKKGSHQS